MNSLTPTPTATGPWPSVTGDTGAIAAPVLDADGDPSEDRPWLVGDIGGTNARFALLRGTGGDPRELRTVSTAGYHDLAGPVRSYLDRVGGPLPRRACIAIAGPVGGDVCSMTNANISFSRELTSQALALDSLELINDLAAAALAAPATQPADYRIIGSRRPIADLPVAVVGVGTGLGVATLIPHAGTAPVLLPGEGGHALLAAQSDYEIELLRAARAENVRLTAEMVLSGPGLLRLYRLTSRVGGTDAESLTPEQVSNRALAGSDPVCMQALTTFCELLGAVSSGIALTTGARGGLYLTGAMLAGIADFLERSRFRERFDGNPVMSRYLESIATVLVLDSQLPLRGAAQHLLTQLTPSRRP